MCESEKERECARERARTRERERERDGDVPALFVGDEVNFGISIDPVWLRQLQVSPVQLPWVRAMILLRTGED